MRDKKVKIIATLGPSSDSKEKIQRLAEEGVDVFRINLSHAKHEDVIRVMEDIRKVEKEHNHPLAIMGDLAGPKIRIGKVPEPTLLVNEQLVTITTQQKDCTAHSLSVNYPSIIEQLKTGAFVYIDDGRIQLEVTEEGKDTVKAKVVVGGPLVSFKGFYAEGISLDLKGAIRQR